MNHTSRLKKLPLVFRRLTGITPEKFDEILVQLTPLYRAWNLNRLSRRERKRKIGGGHPFCLHLEDRLLMLLIYYRTYTTHMFLGFMFGVRDSSVSRNINPLQPLLAQIFRIPERRVSLSEDEIAELFFDGTEQSVHRPQQGQRKWYSGKKKRHTIKHQIVVVKKRKRPGVRRGQKRKLRIAAVSKSFGGHTHDKKIYDTTRTTTPPGVPKTSDTGYIGTVMHTPHKKPRKKELTARQKRGNRRLSSRRIVVEHGIGKMKIWRMIRDVYRNLRSNHTLVMKNIAGLHNIMYA